MARRYLVLLYVLLLGVGGFGQKYAHKLMLDDLSFPSGGVITDNGHYFIGGVPLKGSESFVFIKDGVNIPYRYGNVIMFGAEGLDNDGNWMGVAYKESQFDEARVVYNGEVVNPTWGDPNLWYGLRPKLSPNGVTSWTNYGNPGSVVYKNGVEYSTNWTDGLQDAGIDMTSDGRLLWGGYAPGATTPDLWLEGVPINRQYNLGEWQWDGRRIDINDSAQLLWTATRPSDPNRTHLFLGDYDLTGATLGPNGYVDLDGNGRNEGIVSINNAGHVLWPGYPTPDGVRTRMYLDNQMLYRNLLASSDTSLGKLLDDRGDVAWSLIPISGLDRLFLNDYELTSVTGTTYSNFQALSLNNASELLWAGKRKTGEYDIWLTSPVPEPGNVAMLFTGLLLLARVRRPLIPRILAKKSIELACSISENIRTMETV